MLQGLRTLFFVWQVFVILCILDREGVKRANSEQKLPVTERNRRVSSLSVRLLVFISSNGMKMVQQKMETDQEQLGKLAKKLVNLWCIPYLF